MKQLFVSIELAKLANKKKFDNNCLAYYDVDMFDDIQLEIVRNSDYNLKRRGYVAAPLYQQLVDWFREEKELQIELTCWYGTKFWKFEIFRVGNHNRENLFPIDWSENNEYHKLRGTSSVFTYYEALQAALTHAFTLI